MQFIDIKKQYQLHKEEIDKQIHEVLDSGIFIMGPKVKELEEKLAEFVGVKHCIAVSSGTDSLLITLMAMGIGAGDEVITTPFSMIATAEVIALLGAKPVFVDVEDKTYHIDITQIEAAITPKTKAIMPVSLYGQMPDYDAINVIADRHGIPVIEDAAQSFGASRNGKMSCSMTAAASTSFFPAKPLGCYGDGGAIFTNDDALADKMCAIRLHGGKQRYHHLYIGINGRCDAIQAAVLLAKLPHFKQEIHDRQRIGARYTELLKECCRIPYVDEGCMHIYAQYTLRVEERDRLVEELDRKGIPTAVHYPKCIHQQPAFVDMGYKSGTMPVAEQLAKEVISLPMHPWLTEEDQDRIVAAVKETMSVLV